MIDLRAVEVELHNARRARVSAELACCEIEELAEEMRQSHRTWLRLTMAQRIGPDGWVARLH
jgi:hypothetical protein